MKRREFLLVSAGGGTAIAASGTAAGQERYDEQLARSSRVQPPTLQQEDTNNDDDEDANDDDEVDNDEPEEVVVELGNYFYRVAETGQDLDRDEPLGIEPGTTVRFVWITDNHDIAIDAKPDESDWDGETLHDTGHEHEWTFDVEGTYEFHCTPHIDLGMIGTIIVEEGITDVPDEPLPPGEQPIDPDEIGVPLQKHFIGIATFFAIFVTLVFAFYVLKYGETPHSGYPNKK